MHFYVVDSTQHATRSKLSRLTIGEHCRTEKTIGERKTPLGEAVCIYMRQKWYAALRRPCTVWKEIVLP